VMTVKNPAAAAVQYLMLVLATAGGMLIILNGIVVEMPPVVNEAIHKFNVRMVRLFGRPATA
jgi:lipopolysaccharide export system permease protein